MPPIKTEDLPHDGGHIVSELGTFSREIVTIADGQNLKAGAVLGTIGGSGADAGHYAAYDGSGATGIETATGVLFADIDASEAAVDGVAHVRGPCEMHEGRLRWGSDQDANEIAAGKVDLAALDIVLRQ